MNDLRANPCRVRREGKPPRILRERGFRLRHALFEYFFRRGREAISDISRAVGDFEQMAAMSGPERDHKRCADVSLSTSGAARLASGRLSASTWALRSAARSIREAASAGFDVSLANWSSVAACRVK